MKSEDIVCMLWWMNREDVGLIVQYGSMHRIEEIAIKDQ